MGPNHQHPITHREHQDNNNSGNLLHQDSKHFSGPSGYQIQSSQQGYQCQPITSGFQQVLPPPPGFSMQPAQSGYIPGVNAPSGYTQGPLQQSQGQSSFKRIQGSGENHNQDATQPRVAFTTVGQYSRDSIIMQTANT